MSSTTENQKEIAPRSDSISPSKDVDTAPVSKAADGMPSPAKQTGSAKNELATQLAALKVADEEVSSDIEEEKAVDKANDDDEFFSDEEAEQEQEHPVKVGNENIKPKLTSETAPKPEDAGGVSVKKDEEATTPSKTVEEQTSQTIKISPKFATETARKLEATSSVSAKQTEEATTSKGDGEGQVSHPVKKVDENADPKLPLEITPNLEDTIGVSVKTTEEEATTTSKGEEEQASHQIRKVDDNINPKLPLEIAPNLKDTIGASVKKAAISKSEESQVDQNVNLGKLTYEAAPKPEDTGSASAKTTEEFAASNSDSTTISAVPTDETATPRLSAYIKLHNDMMTAKSTLSSTPTEQSRLYHHASHIARTLLVSNAKHHDLPLVIHAHACMVIGCSDVDDCFEKMEEALMLVRQAVAEGLLTEKEGTEMVVCCEGVMRMAEEGLGGFEGDEGDWEEDGDEGDGDEEGEERFELP